MKGGGFICSRIRLHQFHVWFCRGMGNSLRILSQMRVGDRFEFVGECGVVFVIECGVELGHDGVKQVLGWDLFVIEEVEVLLLSRFQSWSLNHHSRRVSLVENQQGGVADVAVWDGLSFEQVCDEEKVGRL